MGILLEVKNLHVSFNTCLGNVKAVNGVSFHVSHGETIAIVGESGCGKSVTAQAIMRLIQSPPGIIEKGEIFFNNDNIVIKSDKDMEKMRGKDISIIFQDPMTSLNPTMRVGKQIMEGLIKHQKMSKFEAKRHSLDTLESIGISTPHKLINLYPYQLSGGMRQRIMIAIALSCNPKLLIADEPTTALDVTIQAQILTLMEELQNKTDTSIIIITHDLGIVAKMCKRILVMYAGEVVESGTSEDIFYNTKHPYTHGLLKSIPRMNVEKVSSIYGSPPDLCKPIIGCAFCDRCKYSMEVCKKYHPSNYSLSDSHIVSCHLYHKHAKHVLEKFNKKYANEHR